MKLFSTVLFRTVSDKMKSTLTVCVILCLVALNNANSVFQRLKEGLQMAGKFLDFEQHSKSITNMVSKAFISKANKEGNEETGEKEHVFSGFLRLLGFGPRKLGAVVLNAVIFIAQLISTSLDKPTPPYLIHERKIDDNNMFEWISNNPGISDLLTYAKTENLVSNIVKHIKENSLDEDSGCLQLLFCKSSPFVEGMQKALNNVHTQKGVKAFFEFLPNRTEIIRNGKWCEKRYPYCTIHF